MDKLATRDWPDDMGKPLTAKQWDALREWFATHREYFEGRSVIRILTEKRPEGMARCPVRSLDANMVIEAAHLAKVRLKQGRICNRCNALLNDAIDKSCCSDCGSPEFRWE